MSIIYQIPSETVVTGEKLFACTECESTFSGAAQLKNHKTNIKERNPLPSITCKLNV